MALYIWIKIPYKHSIPAKKDFRFLFLTDAAGLYLLHFTFLKSLQKAPAFNERILIMAIPYHIQDEVNEMRLEQNRVEKIKTYLANNLTKDLSIAAVSQKFEVSASTLRHIFKNHQQQSYRHYLEGLRMDKALEFLKEGKWVKEVMTATGYKNRSTFNNAFKKRFKYPASRFKK